MNRMITPEELKLHCDTSEHVDLIDVRTPAEFREVHVSGARNVPLDRLDPVALRAELDMKCANPLYVICRSGTRGKQACDRLFAAGFTDVFNVEGGTVACEKAGLPLVRGRKTISLERQVRIVAGFLVLAGAVLGFFVNPYWVGLSAFVGAGLIFAGIADTCGMAMLLARMPWNQANDTRQTPATGSRPNCVG